MNTLKVSIYFCHVPIRGQELSCAKEGLCMIEDAQSETGNGGQVGNVAFPGRIMADGETQKLE